MESNKPQEGELAKADLQIRWHVCLGEVALYFPTVTMFKTVWTKAYSCGL